ncbi:DUF4889 domain-containing protein [Staphylococcus casei]|uniref:DUF4889 domain-containing protein n=1 Tax=Staphylococcus TaxID=1279 RepID=UPI000CCFFFFC|nr:DUF4889 domain-containing protein [Staphylococcus casei]PNZ58793.1 DUF4889 domain-containing protein [Staphylococcus casei]PTI80164.1 DUF4889 domain-containing protein [Staphylococcus succinus]WJE86193.1 DUF4889 domain-containing protein [Staphylococcus casei]
MKHKLTISLISALIIIGVAVTVMMLLSSQKSTYYGYMANATTAEKVVSEKDGLVTNNIKLKHDEDFKPQKGDFVKLISKDDGETFYKKEVVSHDDIPHGLMMKIHDMDM